MSEAMTSSINTGNMVIVTAASRPMAPEVSDRVNAVSEKSVVALLGPPRVRRNGRSKSLSVPIVEMSDTMMTTGRIIGKVMHQNVCHRLAPSFTCDCLLPTSGGIVTLRYRVVNNQIVDN